jgi:hypothetical protein
MNKIFLKLLLSGSFALLIASPTWAVTASGGTVTFVGTLSQIGSGSTAQARFRVRLTGSTCNGVTLSTRWIHVESGTGAHNLENFRNAYGTLTAAQLSGKRIQMGGLPNCDSSLQTISLPSSDIGMY